MGISEEEMKEINRKATEEKQVLMKQAQVSDCFHIILIIHVVLIIRIIRIDPIVVTVVLSFVVAVDTSSYHTSPS